MSSKDECESLMSAVLPRAEELLLGHRELFPFAATLSASGEIAHVPGFTGSERPPTEELIALLEAGFREGAARGELVATALLCDVLVVPPGKSERQDAIAVRLDHRDDYSIVVLFPYVIAESGALTVDEPFATAGAGAIFPR